jgi:MFS family permease
MSFISSRWTDVYLAAGARAVSSCGDLLAATALVLQLQARGAGGYAVAAMLIAATLPPVLLARWAGRLADRADSRLLLTITGLAQAGACLALAFASSAGEMIALVSVLAAGLAVTQPCLSALVPSMVTAGDLPRAVALGQTATSAGTMLAPALGGILLGHFGLRVPLLADAASYLAIAGAGWLIRTRRSARAEESLEASTGQADGWELRQDRLLWSAVVLIGAVVAAVSLVNVAEVFFVRGVLHSTTTVYGLLESVWTCGSVVGAWLLARRRPADPAMAVALLGALAITCLSVALIATAGNVGWLVPLSVAGGLANGGLNTAANVLMGRRVPAAVRGRAFALFYAVANAATTLGYLAGGLLLALMSVRVLIASAGLAGLAVTAAFTLPVLRASAREKDHGHRGESDTSRDNVPTVGQKP